MSDDPFKKQTRRPRYHGINPRRFDDKYKEHQPDRYENDVAKVLAGGKTPAGMHRPIMVQEILRVLAPKPGEVVVDCTLGYGGHARELLTAVQPGGRLIGIDADPAEIAKTEARLKALGFPAHAVAVHRSNFAGIASILATESPDGVDIIFADLGVSSMQIDNPARGFSFKGQGPLDMRMNSSRGKTVSELLSSLDPPRLAALLTENADEPDAALLAKEILAAHSRSKLLTTNALADVVRSAVRKHRTSDKQEIENSVRRIFQALRIAVNDEFGSLEALLRAIPSCLKPGGRVAILTFHSGEDRRVKSAFKSGLNHGIYGSIAEDVIRASPEERRDNPRCSAAKMRFGQRAN